MPIVNTGDKFKYVEPPENTILKEIFHLNLLFTEYINDVYKYDSVDTGMDMDVLYDICVHADKRNVHAKLFHDIDDSSEFRIVSLFCYWITRLHPFYLYETNGKNKVQIADINESFSVYLCMRLINSLQDLKSQPIKLNRRFFDELKYTLRYREINKATLILLLESKFTYIN